MNSRPEWMLVWGQFLQRSIQIHQNAPVVLCSYSCKSILGARRAEEHNNKWACVCMWPTLSTHSLNLLIPVVIRPPCSAPTDRRIFCQKGIVHHGMLAQLTRLKKRPKKRDERDQHLCSHPVPVLAVLGHNNNSFSNVNNWIKAT